MRAFNPSDLPQLGKELLTIIKKENRKTVFGDQLDSPRSVGDAVESYMKDCGLRNILWQNFQIKLDDSFGRRAMADMAFEDSNGNKYYVDVKTHNLATDFNMPNLTSVKRINDFYESDKNHFCILIVSYYFSEKKQCFDDSKIDCKFNLIESFDWECLHLGALGWGQIQIANANNISFYKNISREKWMNTLCVKVCSFYDNEIEKIKDRKKLFIGSQAKWV